MKQLAYSFCFSWLATLAVASTNNDWKGWYDPARDPFQDFRQAITLAQAEQKVVLITVGGDWCGYCHDIAHFMKTNPKVNKALNEHFVQLKVNISEENDNAEFLSHFPEFNGVPHFFVLDASGQLLNSQPTGDFEGFFTGYSEFKFLTFLRQFTR